MPSMPAPLIDVHAHFLTPDYVAAATTAGHAHPDGMRAWPQWNVDEQLRMMDRAGIDRAMLSISSPGVFWHDGLQAGELARHVNEAAAAVVARHPDRFGFLATLPLPDIDTSIQEAEHAFDRLDASGVIVLTRPGGVMLADPALTPVLADLDARRSVVLIHPTARESRLRPAVPPPAIDFVLDTTEAVTGFVHAGLLERYARLRIIVPHLAAGLSVLAARIDAFAARATSSRGSITDAEKIEPRLRALWVDCAGPYSTPGWQALTAAMNPAHLIYGSDHCWTPAHAVLDQIRAMDAGLSDLLGTPWRTLLGNNSAHLFAKRRVDGA